MAAGAGGLHVLGRTPWAVLPLGWECRAVPWCPRNSGLGVADGTDQISLGCCDVWVASGPGALRPVSLAWAVGWPGRAHGCHQLIRVVPRSVQPGKGCTARQFLPLPLCDTSCPGVMALGHQLCPVCSGTNRNWVCCHLLFAFALERHRATGSPPLPVPPPLEGCVSLALACPVCPQCC